MPKVIGFDPVDLGFGGMINYSGKNNNKVLAKVKSGSYPKLLQGSATPIDGYPFASWFPFDEGAGDATCAITGSSFPSSYIGWTTTTEGSTAYNPSGVSNLSPAISVRSFNNFTVSTWIEQNGTWGTTAQGGILDGYTADASANGNFSIYRDGSAIDGFIYQDTNGSRISRARGMTEVGKIHLAWVVRVDDNIVDWYVNGVLIQRLTGLQVSFTSGSMGYRFSDSYDNESIKVINQSIFKGAMTDQNVEDLYNLGHTALNDRTLWTGGDASEPALPAIGPAPALESADPYISSVKLLLQPTTSDTTIVDKSGTASITGNTSTVLDSDGKFTGYKSMNFGYSGGNTNNIRTNSVYNTIGTQDFTIEFWFKAANVDSGTNNHIFRSQNSNLLVARNGQSSPGDGSLATGGSVFDGIGIGKAYTAGVWYHVALTRQGTTGRIFQNGVLKASNTTSGESFGTVGNLYIGNFTSPQAQYSARSKIQSLRMTVGVARYTSNFTAPTAAFPTPT